MTGDNSGYRLSIGLKYLRDRENLTSRYDPPPRVGGVSARKLVLKPILAKISVLKHLDHVPGEGLGGRRRRPKLDKSGQKLKELKVFLCPETRKTSSFCAPHGATICPLDSVLPKVHNDLRFSSASEYG